MEIPAQSASQREEIEKYVMKIKATGKAKLEDLVMMKDASNYESVVAALHAAKAEAFEILGTELTQKLKSMVKGTSRNYFLRKILLRNPRTASTTY